MAIKKAFHLEGFFINHLELVGHTNRNNVIGHNSQTFGHGIFINQVDLIINKR